ncbi:2649a89d-aa88-4129-9c18-f99901bdcb14 [Thermothielavioides terrestris]|uniref:Chromosome segregation in meiosis protein n=2 Tax=Thermothielavioides terrestris TaxID=2587410 RepID=G2R1U2_THETT|nr:uncharacterized protein THITE_2111309 [Thermothielavioides terrestris NRRL 8126]AEO64918.1 hypothetical protein THITE_2111309 [Thermothielavioides terrestris NRRL 8126]SPQ19832.1 2649a89d-aa88-4129-9c18-f99901bdcb14 [Thermothielavioides terrestris]
MTSRTANSVLPGRDSGNFVNDYLADWPDDDPFRSPSPEPAKTSDRKENAKKRDVLGIETQLDLKRKPRAPRVKLDETRLLSDKGIPRLRRMAPKLKLKGKGHEFSDAARLLSFYQEWLDDLFPKATFLDALAMVEKEGHKTAMRNARQQWIDEDKPKPAAAEAEDDQDYRLHQGSSGPRQPERVAPVFEKAAQAGKERARTPAADDLFGDDDIYNATPRRDMGSTAPAGQVVNDGVPDEDDLDALMAEAEAEAQSGQSSGVASAPFTSIFGDGSKTATSAPAAEPDEDDLDALMAEVEAEGGATTRPSNDQKDSSSAGTDTGQPSVNFEDDEEAMAEMDGLW